MAYQTGDVIQAVHFNTFSDDTAFTYAVGDGDSGYGQTTFPLINVAIGKIIEAQEWRDMVNAISVCGVHQGTVTTPNPFTGLLTDIEVGDFVQAHDQDPPSSKPVDLIDTIALVQANRLNYDPGSVSVLTDQLVSSRGAAWSNTIQHRFTVIFPTADQARYFFNSGGEIRVRGSRSGGSATPQNTAWTSLLATFGTFSMSVHGSATTGTLDFLNSGVGYFELTTGFQTMATVDGTPPGGAYGTNSIVLEARTMDPTPVGANNDNGRRLEFRITYTDAHSNVFFDTVDGTITSNVDMQIATSPLTIAAPAFATVVPLTAGA